MICEHLKQLEQALESAGIRETFRGQSWVQDSHEWVYYDCVLNSRQIREDFKLDECVYHFSENDPKGVRLSGFVCSECNDAVIGSHVSAGEGKPLFPTDSEN